MSGSVFLCPQKTPPSTRSVICPCHAGGWTATSRTSNHLRGGLPLYAPSEPLGGQTGQTCAIEKCTLPETNITGENRPLEVRRFLLETTTFKGKVRFPGG